MRYADAPTTENAVYIQASPERVWAQIADIGLMAELSDELQEVEWLPAVAGVAAAGGPAVGDTFRGRNQHPGIGEWETVSSVIECDPARVFAWAVGEPERPGATWRFTLTPSGDGTELRQSARVGPGRSQLNPVIERLPDKEEKIVANRLEEFRAGIDRNLAVIKERAEGGAGRAR